MGKHHIPLVIEMDDGEKIKVGEADLLFDPISEEMEVINVEVQEKYQELVRDSGAAYSVSTNSLVTRSNPSGSMQQCDSRALHGPHEWQAEFGSYFNVYCPGNDGKHR